MPTGNYEEALVPGYVLPDPLKMSDGSEVKTAEQWLTRRRPELLELFSRIMYGQAPRRPRATSEIVDEKVVMDGRANRQRVRVTLTPAPNPLVAELLVYKPNRPGRHPAFLGLNFKGNHAVTTDADIPQLAVKAAEPIAARGESASRWPAELIVSRGFALATMCYQEVEPDEPEGWRGSVRGRIEQMTGYPAARWGAIAAWAWGLSCAMDHLESDGEIDAMKVAVMGHSRLGKTALWAGVTDERFAVTISNDSGEGGAALSKRCFGETVDFITRTFPHWFVSEFRKYAGKEAELPIDQHELIALLAPRPVYIASAAEDLWADPKGEFLSGVHAESVYRLFGRAGLGTSAMPELERSVGNAIGYHIRRGKHDVMRYDWEQFMAFAERWFGCGSGGSAVR